MKAVFAFVLVAAALAVITPFAAASPYSSKEAMDALFYSRISNCPAAFVTNFSCGPSCDRFGADMSDVSVYTNVSQDTRAWVGYNNATNMVVATIRGSRNFMNWIEDFDFLPTDYPHCAGCKVHRGFYDVLHGLASVGLMKGMVKTLNKYPKADVLINGHSLGAAVATLMTAELLRLHPGVAVNRTFNLYTFGSPRVGNPALAKFIGEMLPQEKQHRLTHHRDPVPHVPPQHILGHTFLHVPQEVYFSGNTSTDYVLCNDSLTKEDPNCADSQLPIDPYDHIWYLGTCMGCCATKSPGAKDDNCCDKLPLRRHSNQDATQAEVAQELADVLLRFHHKRH